MPQPPLLIQSVKKESAVKTVTDTTPSIKKELSPGIMSPTIFPRQQTTKAEILNYIFGRKSMYIFRFS